MSQGAGIRADERKAVVICLARANDQGHTSLIFCLSKSGKTGPFQLRTRNVRNGRYIWRNQDLRENRIKVGSVITYKRFYHCCLFTGNTGKKVVSLAFHFVPKHGSS